MENILDWFTEHKYPIGTQVGWSLTNDVISLFVKDEQWYKVGEVKDDGTWQVPFPKGLPNNFGVDLESGVWNESSLLDDAEAFVGVSVQQPLAPDEWDVANTDS